MIEVKDIGELRHRVVIQSTTTAIAANGERTETFSTYATRWAKIEYSSGSEMAIDDIAFPIRKAKVTMRYDSAVTEKYRLTFNSQTWNIRGIEYNENKMYMALTCDST